MTNFKEGAKIGGRFVIGAAKEIAKAGASEIVYKVGLEIIKKMF